jgi:hypothetical protein
MLFNLSQQTQFKTHRTGKEIFCWSGCGPCYGNTELAADEPFNGDGNCKSRANSATFKIPLKDGKNTLTNKEDGWFTITELEVWQVTEEVTNYLLIYIGTMKKKSERKRETREDKRQTRQRVCYLLFYQ